MSWSYNPVKYSNYMDYYMEEYKRAEETEISDKRLVTSK